MHTANASSLHAALAVSAFVLLFSLAAIARPLLFSNQDSCNSGASINPATGQYVLSCGSSCGPNNNRPCVIKAGGVPGANFQYCGCSDVAGTPICCFTAIDVNTNTVFANGLCNDYPVASHCGPPPCTVVPTGGGGMKAACNAFPPL